jgi:holdfast attachment protein HfaA
MMEADFEPTESFEDSDLDVQYDGLRYKRRAGAAFSLATIVLAGAAFLAASGANAQTVPSYANEFTQPYGSSSYDLMTPYDATTRDSAANRVIIDGVIMYGDNIAQSLANKALGGDGTSYSGTGYAIGNQLNVSVSGSYNNVIVDSTQINNGDQTVVINNGSTSTSTNTNSSSILNGGLNF